MNQWRAISESKSIEIFVEEMKTASRADYRDNVYSTSTSATRSREQSRSSYLRALCSTFLGQIQELWPIVNEFFFFFFLLVRKEMGELFWERSIYFGLASAVANLVQFVCYFFTSMLFFFSFLLSSMTFARS